MLTVSLLNTPKWVEQGPGPINNGNNVIISPNREQAGATQAIAVDPTNSARVFVATVDGGIWSTTNFTAAQGAQLWTPRTDMFPSLSFGDVEFSPLDPTENTLYAGTGRFSNGFGDGSTPDGILKTTDGGLTWTQLGEATFNGVTIIKVVPTDVIDTGTGPGRGGQVILVATLNNSGLWRSTDGGLNFTEISNAGSTNGLPLGQTTDLVSDPGNINRFYTAIPGQGVFISSNAGATWTPVDTGLNNLGVSNVIKLAVPNNAGNANNAVFAAVAVPKATNANLLDNVYRSTNQGGNWTAIGTAPNTNPLGQVLPNLTLAADPAVQNVVYVTGDKGTANNAGDVFQGNATTNTWISVANGNAGGTAPHPDSRAMAFLGTGVDSTLVESDDGGIYRLIDPNNTSSSRTWQYADGNIRPTEFYSIAYDSVNGDIFGGAQDNSVPEQNSPGSFTWTDTTGGDGTEVGVDNNSTPGSSIRYMTNQNLGNFHSEVWTGNTLGTSTSLGLVVNGTGGQNIYTVEANLPGGAVTPTHPAPGTILFFTPWVINSVAPTDLIIGTNSLYESTDSGATLTALGGVTAIGGGNFVPTVQLGTVNPAVGGVQAFTPIAYGGVANGLPNAAVLWVGAGGQLYLRTSGSGLPTLVGSYPGAAVTSIQLDPTNWRNAFVLDANGQVWNGVTDLTGSTFTWTNVTGNLGTVASSLRVLSVVRNGSNLAVLAGGYGGVFTTLNPTATSVWTSFGQGIPNAIVRDMHYVPPNATNPSQGDLLVIGTDGRGAFTLSNVAALVVQPLNSTLEIRGDENAPNENDTFKLELDAVDPAFLDVYVNSVLESVVPIASVTTIAVDGGGGNDTLIVDSSNGLISVPNGIQYDGGTGFNNLQLVQTGGTTQSSDNYSPGPNPGEGTDVITGPGGTQSVFFQNLAPVLDTVSAALLLVSGTPANNAISYAPGLVDPVNDGLVTVDNFESIEFANKANLGINTGLGTDTVSINDSNTPTGLIDISVAGGDPNANDALSINGVAATVDVDTAAQIITGATGTGGAVGISYSDIKSLNVASGSSTTLALSGSDTYVYTPAAASDGGTVQTASLPITFSGFGAGTTLALTGLGVSTDSLVANGTAANDTFTVAATTGAVTITGRATITTASIPNLTLNGLDGDDTFNVTGPQPYTTIVLSGGDPSGSDTANVTGNGTDVIADIGGTTASVTGGGLGTVSLPGIEVLNLDAGAGNITLAGTAGTDAFVVTPTGSTTATAQANALAPVVNTTNSGTLTVDGGGGTNSLTVNGTSGSDTINVSGTAVTVVGLQTVNFANVESLQVNGLAGSDTFNVTSSPTVPISIDGGDPVGVSPGDLLNVLTNPGDTVAFSPGPTSDSGGFVVNNNQPISFVHIESISVSGGGTPVISGTNGNDVITIIARDSSYAAAADGVQDFTVSVDAGPTFLFINTPSLIVHALAGDDQIVLETPAPDLAAWNVAVTVDGGPSSALGDQLVVSTPGANQVTYTPTSANSGSLGITNINGLVSNVAITDIENFVYDGRAGGDTLTMMGSSAANNFVLTPGATNDAGTLSMDSTLPVTFENLGTAGQLIINGNGGADSLTYDGTATNDTFTIATSTSPPGGEVTLNSRVPVITTAIATLSLEGLAGDDTFTLIPSIAASPYTTLHLDGGSQASTAGDQANLTAAAAADVTVSGQTVKQGGVTVVGSGLENINLNGAGNRLIYNGVPGVTENINVIASPTANSGQVSVPGVTQVTFANVIGLVVNGNPADNDTLTFQGTNNSDRFQINLAAAGTAADPVLKLQTATGAPLLALQNYTGFATLNVAGLDGNDTFNIYTGPTAPSDPNTPGGRNVFINGNLPTGKKKGTDVVHVFYTPKRPKIVETIATQNPTAGQMSLDYGTANYLVGWAGIENVTIQRQ